MTTNYKLLRQAMREVEAEVVKATSKYGPFNNTHEGFAVLKEEVDELWDEVKKNSDVIRLREEAIQVAAMGIRFMMDCAEENPSLTRQQALMALASGKVVTDRIYRYELLEDQIEAFDCGRKIVDVGMSIFFASPGPFIILVPKKV